VYDSIDINGFNILMVSYYRRVEIDMIEPTKELKRICKKEGDVGLLLPYFYRPVSYLFIRPLLVMGISANGVTVLSMLIGLLGSMCFLSKSFSVNLLGVILFFLWYIGECCDGAVARYHIYKHGGKYTKLGRYLDWLNMRIVTFALYTVVLRENRLLWGFVIFSWFMASVLPGIKRYFGIED
jgi:hypothetical protein